MAFRPPELSSTPHNPSTERKSFSLRAFSGNSTNRQFPLLNSSNQKRMQRTFNRKCKLQPSAERHATLPDDENEQSLSDITCDESEEEWQLPGNHPLSAVDKNFPDVPVDEDVHENFDEVETPANEADISSTGKKRVLDISSHNLESRANALNWGLWRCPVLSELIRGLTDACAFHQWDVVLALLPCIAIRSFPMLSLQYSVEMATALENCGALKSENMQQQLRRLAPNKTVQLLSSIVQHCSQGQTGSGDTLEPSSHSNVSGPSHPLDFNTEAVLQEWDKFLAGCQSLARHKGHTRSEAYFVDAYKGILCYVRWKKMEQNNAISSDKTNPQLITTVDDPDLTNSDSEDVTDFALQELTRDVGPEDLADQVVVLMEEALDAIPEPCEWMLLPLLECLEKSRGTTAAYATASKYLRRHPTHAPAFCAVLQYTLAHCPTHTSTHVAIMKHVQQLSPGAEQVLHLVQIILDDPRSYDTTNAEEALGLTPVQPEAALSSEGPDNQSLRADSVVVSASEVCDGSLVGPGSRRAHLSDSSAFSCPLRKDMVLRSRVYCVRVLVRLLHLPHHRHALRPWELLGRALTSLHRSWIRCWDCSGCRKSRQDLVPVVTMWWWLWWRQIALAHSGAGSLSDGVNLKCDADAKLILNRAVVAHILCIDASSDVWWSALSSSGWVRLAEELRECVFCSGPHAHHFTQYRAAVIRRRQEMFGKNVSCSAQLRPPIRGELAKPPSGLRCTAAKSSSTQDPRQSDAPRNIRSSTMPSRAERANSSKESHMEATADESGDNRSASAVEGQNGRGTRGNCSRERKRMLEQRLMGGKDPDAHEWVKPALPATKRARVTLDAKMKSDAEKFGQPQADLASPIISRIAPLSMSDTEDCYNLRSGLNIGKKGRVSNSRPKKKPQSKTNTSADKDDQSASVGNKLTDTKIKNKSPNDESSGQRRKPAVSKGKETSKTRKEKENTKTKGAGVAENQQNNTCFSKAKVHIAPNSELSPNSVENPDLEAIGQEHTDNPVEAVESGPVPAVKDSVLGGASQEDDVAEEMSQTGHQSAVDAASTDGVLVSQPIPCGQLVSSQCVSPSLRRKGSFDSLTVQNLSRNINKCLDEIFDSAQPCSGLKLADTNVAAVPPLSEASQDPHSPDIIPSSLDYENTDLSIPKLFTTKSLLSCSVSENSQPNIFGVKDISDSEIRAPHQNPKTPVQRIKKQVAEGPHSSPSIAAARIGRCNSEAHTSSSLETPEHDDDGTSEGDSSDEVALYKFDEEESHEPLDIPETDVDNECQDRRQSCDEGAQITDGCESTKASSLAKKKIDSGGSNLKAAATIKMPSSRMKATLTSTEIDEPTENVQSDVSGGGSTVDSAGSVNEMPRQNQVPTESFPIQAEVRKEKTDCDEETQDLLHEKPSIVTSTGNVYIRRKKLVPAHQIVRQDSSDSEDSSLAESNPSNNRFGRGSNLRAKRKQLPAEVANCEAETLPKTSVVLETDLPKLHSDQHPDGSTVGSLGRSLDAVGNFLEAQDLNPAASTKTKPSKKRKKDHPIDDRSLKNVSVPSEDRNRKENKKKEKLIYEKFWSSFMALGATEQKVGEKATDSPRKNKKMKTFHKMPAVSPATEDHQNRNKAQRSRSADVRQRKRTKKQEISVNSPVISTFGSEDGEHGREKHVKNSSEDEKAKPKKRNSKGKERIVKPCTSFAHASTPVSRAPALVPPKKQCDSIYEQLTKPEVAARGRSENSSPKTLSRPRKGSEKSHDATTKEAKASKKKKKSKGETTFRRLNSEEMLADFEKYALIEYNYDFSKEPGNGALK